MIIGIPKEVKVRENRVSMVPGAVELLVHKGHNVYIQKNAGKGAGIEDLAYEKAGAVILPQAADVWDKAEMIVKVKEPIPQEYELMREGQILYTYLHLAAAPELTGELLKRKVTGIAYETIQGADGSLPLLKPMSEVAGRMAVQVGVQCLEKNHGGKGLLLGGVPGVKRGRVTIIGGGVVGINSAKIAIGMGANVSIVDIDQERLAYLDDIFGNQVTTLMSNPENIAQEVALSDLVVGAVLVTGGKAPQLVTEAMIKTMEKGSVVVDVAIDQGGSIATIKPTTHEDPVFQVHGVNHYGVTNIPGAVPMTSTYALTNVTFKYALEIANKGVKKALSESPELLAGLNSYQGLMTCEPVARDLGLSYSSPLF